MRCMDQYIYIQFVDNRFLLGNTGGKLNCIRERYCFMSAMELYTRGILCVKYELTSYYVEGILSCRV